MPQTQVTAVAVKTEVMGQPIQGNWKLKIPDVVGQDAGKLNKWSIKVIKQ